MKPNIGFLLKVKEGKVYPYASYSPRTGRTDRFRGGQKTAEAHADAGYVVIHSPRHVMMSGSVKLTPTGLSALNAAGRETCQS